MKYVVGLNYEDAILLMKYIHSNTNMVASLGQWCVMIQTQNENFTLIENYLKNNNLQYNIQNNNPASWVF